MKNFAENIFSSVLVWFANCSSEVSFEYFVGGSVRFGWFNNNSDVDIFIWNDGTQAVESFINTLRDFGFIDTSKDPYVAKSIQLALGFPVKVHVTFINDERLFRWLKDQHNRIEMMLDKNPILRKYQRVLKHRGMKGKDLYTGLVSVLGMEHTSE